jgi:hypothetical protein|tara:strand:- start:365 stop:529 length:165 start_codon:yes stop_codon:yes gene_type:complete
MNELQLMWDMIVPLVITGITIGIVFSVIAGSIKLGWKLAPYIVLISLVIWYISL